MFAKLGEWFNNRTGCRRLLSVLLIEHIPGGAKWRYVWGSCLAFVFMLQLVTGVLLMTAYSPGATTAWASVHYIQYEMDFGWLIRGLHHFGSQTMVVLLGIHMLQVVIAGAHLPPREINWWLGLVLMGLILVLSLTGYLLPWDQKGYWATQVATNIAGTLPGLGTVAQKLIVGGPEYGNHTLTRFYALHVGILPPLVIFVMALHIAIFRRHGVTASKNAEGEGWFWPDQAFRDLLVSLAIFGVMLALVIHGHGHTVDTGSAGERSLYDKVAHAGLDGKGANLDAPADPGTESYPARPEWYFLFLFQLLKYFEGDLEILGTVVIPHGTMLLLALLPLLGYGRMRGFGHVLGVLVVTGMIAGVATLTCLAVAEDLADPVAHETTRLIGLRLIPLTAAVMLFWLGLLGVLPKGSFRSAVGIVGGVAAAALGAACGYLLLASTGGKESLPAPVVDFVEQRMTEKEKKPSEKAVEFRKASKAANELAHRAVNLARPGSPPHGAVNLLRDDPLVQGPRIFKENCAGCHTHGKDLGSDKSTAWDLEDFGTEKWLLDLLREPEGPRFAGRSEGLKTMTNWVKRERARAEQKGNLKELDDDFALIAHWLGGHPRTVPAEGDPSDLARGYQAFQNRCAECHSYADGMGFSEPPAPDLTGYGDEAWIRLMIMAPSNPSRYGVRNTMPMFLDLQGPGAAHTLEDLKRLKEPLLAEAAGDADRIRQIENAHTPVHLGEREREILIRWLLKDYPVFGGDKPAALH